MKRLAIVLLLITVAPTTKARPVPDWPYATLAKEADFVAVVELVSITNSAKRLTGTAEPTRFQGRIARLKVNWVIKGEPATEVKLLFFAYIREDDFHHARVHFIEFDETGRHQYLVFLKRDGDYLIPVTGQSDGALSVKTLEDTSIGWSESR